MRVKAFSCTCISASGASGLQAVPRDAYAQITKAATLARDNMQAFLLPTFAIPYADEQRCANYSRDCH